ncbi:UHRF1-binding protein 1 [Liparis tanakae]|uniref:UHRF1-binding protein 1 n=1 Tax=Liparis tanakae TaxID=230148 RepID=A0A4Z2I6M3_9TELE|nr:UHRF1-binding protein 1 [Liparis tanakae]
MQLTFRKLGFDYYPVHRPADGCRHWERHSGAMEAQAQWAGKLLQEYQRRAEASGFPGPHPEGPPSTKDTAAKTAQDGQSSPKSSPSDTEPPSSRNSAPPAASLKRLRSSCVVVRMDDVDVHQARLNGPLIRFTCVARSLSPVNGLRDICSSEGGSQAAPRTKLGVALHLEIVSSDKAVADIIDIAGNKSV